MASYTRSSCFMASASNVMQSTDFESEVRFFQPGCTAAAVFFPSLKKETSPQVVVKKKYVSMRRSFSLVAELQQAMI